MSGYKVVCQTGFSSLLLKTFRVIEISIKLISVGNDEVNWVSKHNFERVCGKPVTLKETKRLLFFCCTILLRIVAYEC